jgi:hypothetical protein
MGCSDVAHAVVHWLGASAVKATAGVANEHRYQIDGKMERTLCTIDPDMLSAFAPAP